MKTMTRFGAAVLAAVCGSAATVHAADIDLPDGAEYTIEALDIPSGVIEAPLDQQVVAADAQASNHQLVYSTEVSVPGSDWLRLEFGQVDLPNGAYIVVTSAWDGHHQILDATSIQQWSHTSAYFNGDQLFVDVYVQPGSTARVDIDGVHVPMVSGGVASQCGPWDERTPLIDYRTARHWPVGCTAWTFNNRQNTMGTAGHCAPSGSHVVQFNVPLSTTSGGALNPPPQDQYPIDGSSIRRVNGGVGNDWAVFGVFNNSNTGLDPIDAYADSQPLATAAPSVSGQQIRITGFGSNSTPDPVPNEWDLAQKTHTGPYVQNSGTALRYAPDTSGGNSGSPVIDDSTGFIIGVHTHAGCSTTGGSNQGTSIANSGWRSSLLSTQGSAQGEGHGMIWTPGGAEARPERIAPAGGDTLRVNMIADFTAPAPQAGSLRMQLDTGSGFQPIAPAQLSATEFEFTFPEIDCDTTARYYFTANAANGTPFSWPPSGAARAFSVDVIDEVVLFAYDMEDGTGWQVNGSATAGQFERAVPSKAGKGAPWLDADGSGACWLTGEDSVLDDVDGGATRVSSPTMDISGATDPILTFEYFHYAFGNQDAFRVEISDNNGGSWTEVLNAGSTRGWTPVEVRILDHVSLTSQFKVRAISADFNSSTQVESAFDNMQVVERTCIPVGGCNAADIAEPFGQLTAGDISTFANAFASGDLSADLAEPFGELTFGDIAAFTGAFNAGCP
jgi:V8-like Glu-specific endopeptidase